MPGGNSFCFSLPAPPRQCIDLHFEENYSIESSWECKFDNIEVRDGPFGFSPMLGRYCGQHSPPDIRSSGRYLWLKFVTDGELEAVGFSASYNFTAGTSGTFPPCMWTRLLWEPLVVLSIVCLRARSVFPSPQLEQQGTLLLAGDCFLLGCFLVVFFQNSKFHRRNGAMWVFVPLLWAGGGRQQTNWSNKRLCIKTCSFSSVSFFCSTPCRWSDVTVNGRKLRHYKI